MEKKTLLTVDIKASDLPEVKEILKLAKKAEAYESALISIQSYTVTKMQDSEHLELIYDHVNRVLQENE